jgi:hypothetical protein
VTLAIGVLFAAWMAWVHATADTKIAAGLLSGDLPRAVRVDLRFPPEKFHMLLLQQLGRIRAVEGPSVFLLDVPPPRIREFARHYWVAAIVADDRGTTTRH